MSEKPDDICPRSDRLAPQPTEPAAAPIYTTSVWQCQNTDQAEKLLNGQLPGFVYQRDGHPNAQLLAEKCCRLHRAERAAITSSGMAAMSLALLSQLRQGDHVVAANSLYGRSLTLLVDEAARWGVACTLVDTCDLEETAAALAPNTKMVVVETISNPVLRVADIAELSRIAHEGGALLLVDNTFATPALCQPLELGADLVLESVSKMMNGHSDVMLGMLAASESRWRRVPLVLSAWGLASSPMDCYLATRGLATLPLRVERASDNAQVAAEFLAGRGEVRRVDYPGLPDHPHHDLAKRQFGGSYGTVVAFHLAGGRAAADAFIAAARRIAFCPSLGETSITLSHPESTSHRWLSREQLDRLGIDGGTIRLSLGLESNQFVIEALEEGLSGVANS